MSDWPELRLERDHETLTVLHLAAQMLGKLRVAHAPWVNHGWHVALQPNARGLATMPTAASDGPEQLLVLPRARPQEPSVGGSKHCSTPCLSPKFA